MPLPSPLPPPPLTERPTGLLDLLGIKNGGAYPQHLSETLLPSFPLDHWYAETQVEDAVSGSLALTALGLVTAFTVPAGQAWAIRQLSLVVTADVGAATRERVAHFFVRSSLTTSPVVQLGASDVVGANQRPFPWYEPQQLLILPPGAILGIWVQEVAGVSNLAGTQNIRFVRLFL